jgi:hypothetical protein
MNPFSKHLRQWSNDSQFEAFVDQWDRLERIVIGVYRGKMEVEVAGPEFNQVWPWLREAYGRWGEALRPHWMATHAAGEPTRVDPFKLLLDIPRPEAIPGDWRAMQHLPAAREAINRYLVALSRRYD